MAINRWQAMANNKKKEQQGSRSECAKNKM